MKRIRQTSLQFREGTSDKVYEVDLCEVGPDRFVVNFRFGRRGANLQDGTKTPLPVGRKEADKVYDALVREKTTKGYTESAGAPDPTPAFEVPLVRVEDLDDPRHQQLVKMLAGTARGWTRDPEKLVWRAGELRVRGAATSMVGLLQGATARRQWHVCRALLRLGENAVLPVLGHQAASGGDHVRSMASHAILTLASPADAEPFRTQLAATVPPAARAAFEAGNLAELVQQSALTPDLADRLYLMATEATRPALVALLGRIRFGHPTMLAVRRVYQAAEARSDGEVWGALARRIEFEKPAIRHIVRRRSGGLEGAWSTGTRKWFRRRVWRTLSRAGSAGMHDDYTALAAGLLGAFTTEDPLERHWALGHVLYGSAQGFRANQRRLTWTLGAVATSWGAAVREEAFPALWDAHPERLARLLSHSPVARIHRFACRALRANRPAWSRIAIHDLIAWFASPIPETAEFAAEVALTRYDPRNPDLVLVMALLGCPHAAARDVAAGWVRGNPGPFLRDTGFVVGMVLNREPRTRRLALEILGAATFPRERSVEIVDAVIAAAVAANDDSATERLRDAAAVLVSAFSAELHALPLDLVARLIAHPVAGAAELGAKALLGHVVPPRELPDELLAAAMTSPHAVVRGIGIRLYGELPDAVLAERFRVLLALVTSDLPDVRAASRAVVGRLSSANPGFGVVFLRALWPLMCREGAEGMHADVVSLVRTELRALLPRVDASQVFQALRATETLVQELGGELLRTNVEPGALGPEQLAILASSDVLGVRRTAWVLLEARVDQVRQAPDCVLPLVDARWQDSRQFAFRFITEVVGPEHLGPAVTIAVCDSVRPDVQAFGRSLVTHLFDAADGPRYLQQLAQHPDPSMQLYATAWLEQHAAADPTRLEALAPFLAAVLQRPNRAKAAKARVFAFLARESLRDEASARIVARLLVPLSMSAARTYREAAIGTLTAIHAAFPQVPVALVVVPPEVRGAV